MARRRRKVESKNFDELIKQSEDKIEKLTDDLRNERVNLKNLRKDKATYDAIKEEEEIKEANIKRAAEMIVNSGKSFEEIEALLSQ